MIRRLLQPFAKYPRISLPWSFGPLIRLPTYSGSLNGVASRLVSSSILWRFLGYLPRWRTFFDRASNWLDLQLAVACTVIQLPAVRDSTAYPWLKALQLLRFCRVILEVPRMRPLLVRLILRSRVLC